MNEGKKESLVGLIEQKIAIEQQYMDEETLQWIAQNEPIFSSSTIPVDFRTNFSKKMVPNEAWFIKRERVKTLHGLRHLLRVAIFTEILCNIWMVDERKKRNAVVAAALHDIRRVNDCNDPRHSERVVKWFKESRLEIAKKFNIRLNKNDLQEIYALLHSHDAPYEIIMRKREYKQYGELIDIMKAADALDRYVQPKLKWRIHDAYLVRIPPENYKKFAYDLVLESEKEALKNVDDKTCVFGVLKKIHVHKR